LGVILFVEHATIDVTPGREIEWEETLDRALPLISASPGCEGVRVLRCAETPNRYLLLIEWQTIDDHLVGFQGSGRYESWSQLVREFPIASTAAEHYSLVSQH
jgi:heme-degrading monooxygenase HmoA